MEAAFMSPVLVLILFGIVEMSLLMRDGISVASSVRTGARVASVSAAAGPGGCAGGADAPPCVPAKAPALAQAAADAIQRGASTMPRDSIQYIYVYRANAAGYPFPAANRDISACTTECVRFAWAPSVDRFRYVDGTWDSKTINACVNDVNRMAVGVAMQAKHKWVTGLFGTTMGLDDRTVMQFEPLPGDTCKPGTPSAHP